MAERKVSSLTKSIRRMAKIMRIEAKIDAADKALLLAQDRHAVKTRNLAEDLTIAKTEDHEMRIKEDAIANRGTD